MRFSSSIVALIAAVPLLVSAAPTRFSKRTVAATDILVYKFADVLEQLEAEFYTQALAKFQSSDFTTAGFSSTQIPIEQFTTIQLDESTHSSVLQSAIKSFGAEPITSCKFNFSPVLTDVATMAATARVVEAVGVGAYLGGATLISDPVLLDSAATILTVEARHQTILNVLSSSGTAIPSAFDIALTPSEVLALAGPFFDGPCDVGLPSNPALSLTNTGSVGPGTQLSFSSPAITSSNDTSKLFCQMMVGGQPFSIPLPFNSCVVPSGINGPVAIFITSDGQPLINNVRDRATTQLVAGPAMAFIDTQPQMLGQLARLSGNSAAVSTSTATISPAEASAIVASAGTASPTVAAVAVPSASGDASATPAAASSGVPAASSAAPAASSGAPAASSSSTSTSAVPSTAGGPNTFKGTSPDGSITVNGWTGI